MSDTSSPQAWGATAGGPVERHVIAAGGLRASILTHGGILQSLEVPDRDGIRANVVLGFGSLRGYLDHPDP